MIIRVSRDLLSDPFQLLSELFRMLEVFSIRSSFIHSPKELEKTVGVEAGTRKFANYRIAFGDKFFPQR